MQLRELREYCERRGWIVAREYVDTGFSGEEPLLRGIEFDPNNSRAFYDLGRCYYALNRPSWGRNRWHGQLSRDAFSRYP
jgi:hypothetical protein